MNTEKLLPCGHPGEKHNLINGKCGTCQVAADFELLAKDAVTAPADKKLRDSCLKLARKFRRGVLIFDSKRGQSLLSLGQPA